MHKSCDLTYGLPVTVILLRVGYRREYLVGHRLQHSHLQAACVCPGVSPATEGHHFLPHSGLLAWACPYSQAVAQPCLASLQQTPTTTIPMPHFLGSLTQDEGGCGATLHRGWGVCGGGGLPPEAFASPAGRASLPTGSSPPPPTALWKEGEDLVGAGLGSTLLWPWPPWAVT